MNNFYLLLFMLLLYFFFGEIVDVAAKTSSRLFRMKTKVVFYTFVTPVMFALIILSAGSRNNRTFHILFASGYIVVAIFKVLSTNRKYVTNFQIVENNLTICYLTPYLKSCSRQLKLADISYIEVTEANWLVDYPAAVNIRLTTESDEIQIIDKKLKADVRSLINTANKIHPVSD